MELSRASRVLPMKAKIPEKLMCRLEASNASTSYNPISGNTVLELFCYMCCKHLFSATALEKHEVEETI